MIDVERVASGLHAGLRAANVRYCLYVPDSVMGPLTAKCEADPEIRTIVCAREDEGMSIAAGLFIAGERAVVVMEASGIGYSALILARCQLQRTPVFMMASHEGVLGEGSESHGPTIAAGRGVLSGLHIPHYALRPEDDCSDVVRRALQTVHAQRTSFAILVPPYLLVGEGKGAE
jgi:sulfopyruvate decarboxylase TPP-binding subunit